MTAPPETDFANDLRQHLVICREVMELAARENRALSGSDAYNAYDFYQSRKNLLPRLEQSLMSLRKWRQRRQQAGQVDSVENSDIKALMQSVQSLLMKVLLLDRENQQALLRHGLVPARQLPSSVVQQPHCVADAYRRHARS